MKVVRLPLRETGSDRRHPHYAQVGGEPLREYFAYVPPGGEASPPLVLVHGISRNAAEMVMRFSAHAERCKVPLIAPLFRKQAFGMYQQLVDRRSGVRADDALFNILEDVHARWLVPTRKFHIFGFSGGGQFAHRFAFLHPDRLLSCIAVSAGWYSWPDNRLDWPLGLAGAPTTELDLRALHDLPIHVLVGDRDTRSDESLRRSDTIDGLQGVSRTERAERFCAAMRDRGVNPNCSLSLLPDVGHSFEWASEAGLAERVFEIIGRLPKSVRTT